MSFALDKAIANTGTRFKILVLPPYAGATFASDPEVVVVNVPAGQVKAGPSDDRHYVVDVPNKQPYQDWESPPYQGPSNPPVAPGPGGHFDQVDVGTRAFLSTTMYATVRRTLDIWEGYFKRMIPWQFRLDFKRIELIPAVSWDNAHSGYGFLEFGYARSDFGGPDFDRPYCLNFDVLSHELGHSIIFSSVGSPSSKATMTKEYLGFHESAADLTAIVASLHFNTILDHLLESSSGNLFTVNELSRIGEVSKSDQIRMAFNYEKMSTVGPEAHDLSLPLTGAFFDVLVEVFQKLLLERGLISQELADLAVGPEAGAQDLARVDAGFEAAYQGQAPAFKQALIDARDYLGSLLALVWQNLSPDNFTYVQVGIQALDADQQLTQGKHAETIRSCFVWREIGLTPGSTLIRRFLVRDCMSRSPGTLIPAAPKQKLSKPATKHVKSGARA